MADTTLFPTEPQNLTIYQGTDLEFSLVVRTSEDDDAPLDIENYTFDARFFRGDTTTELVNSQALVSPNVTGQVIVSLPKEQLGEREENTVGSWELYGREPDTVTTTPVTAGSFVTGTKYKILTVGDTDFITIGARSDKVGIIFTATGSGSGAGTASIVTVEGATNIYIPTSSLTVVDNTSSPLRM